jgi:ketosteroid isomerase-like protein
MEVAEREAHSGRDYLVWAYQDLFVGYPDCSSEILNGFAGEDQALVEVQWRGTNSGEFRGEEPSGGAADIRIAYIFRFRDGLISGITEYYDMHTLLGQLSPTE